MTPQQANELLVPQRYEFTSPTWCGGRLSADREEDADGEYVLLADVQEAIDFWNRRAPVAVDRRGCSACDWEGVTDRMCGSVGPLCPECGDTTESLATPASPAVPEGFALVPTEPTAEMLMAGAESEDRDFGLVIHDCYQAMLAAAPQVAQASQPTSAEELQQKEHIPPSRAEPASQPDASKSVLVGGWFNCTDAVYATPDQSSIAGAAKGGITNDSKGKAPT